MMRPLLRGCGLCACVVSCILLATVGCSKSSGGSGKPRIAVIPKGTTHEHWKSVEAGARKAGEELGVQILWKGPLTEDDMKDQQDLVDQFVSEGVSGIVLAPLDSKGLVRQVQSAARQNIPVVICDSALDAQQGKDFVAFVGTDNKKAGRMAGDELARVMGGKGKVVMIRYAIGSASTTAREEGFMEAMAANPGLKVISSDQYAGATVDAAKDKSQNMLDTLRQADGIYTPNESSTQGTLITLRQAGMTKGEGRKKFVGFDASPALVEAVENGELDAVVAQNPFKMGHDAVKALVDHIHGQKVAPVEDTGAVLVTKTSLNDPEVKKLVKH